MGLFRVGPEGKAGDEVELLEEGGDELVGVVFQTELLELSQDSRERGLNIGNGARRD